ncbi:hypothetical protein [Chitinilyticum piscinae]|uniref:Alkaline phytoceramidase n=1 Tax=Chitinilyticum piscinae TaxID=2866724 RepID=A0A8J7FI84_9NEIS|nr:hypothetical protein [Chitinilyticum piscinae]MBE9609775.1 hypothetical protein [Chitinilyticum piscinae]
MSACQRLRPALGLACVIMLLLAVHGPIAQYANYHDFADRRSWEGLPNAADVLSNLGFLLAGLWGVFEVLRRVPPAGGRAGWLLAYAGVALTGLGSSWYHLHPDDQTLVWDRLPIALACAGLLAGVGSELHGRVRAIWPALWLVFWAVSGVWWWQWTADLRPYLMLQLLPLLLLPLWYWQLQRSRGEQQLVLAASLGYVLAKIAELHDQAWFVALSGHLSGHTLKHLFATVACILLVLAYRRGHHLSNGACQQRPAWV